MKIRSTILILAVALALAGCRATQRVDLADNGYADALACLTTHGGDVALAAERCGSRLMAYDGPLYKQGFLSAVGCAKARAGTTESAVAACRGAGPS